MEEIFINSDGVIDSSALISSSGTAEDVSFLEKPVESLTLSEVCLLIIACCCVVSLFRLIFVRAGG